MSGKWHAGHYSMKQTPLGVGFNTSLGYFSGACDHWTQNLYLPPGSTKAPTVDLWDTDKAAKTLNGTVYGDFLYVGRAVKTIMSHDTANPLFYYLAMQCAHDPMEAPRHYKNLYDPDIIPDSDIEIHDMRTEYAFAAIIDEGLSNLTNALKTKGMWDNTLLVVSADK